jgi:hypothetical protein
MSRVLLVVALLSVAAVVRAETTIAVGKMTVNGQEVRDLKCRLKKAGFFAVATVVGALVKQKAAFDACVPGGAAFRVTWRWVGGKATDVAVTAASVKGKNACVARALSRTRASTEGACRAILLVGTPAVAGKAADGLK